MIHSSTRKTKLSRGSFNIACLIDITRLKVSRSNKTILAPVYVLKMCITALHRLYTAIISGKYRTTSFSFQLFEEPRCFRATYFYTCYIVTNLVFVSLLSNITLFLKAKNNRLIWPLDGVADFKYELLFCIRESVQGQNQKSGPKRTLTEGSDCIAIIGGL